MRIRVLVSSDLGITWGKWAVYFGHEGLLFVVLSVDLGGDARSVALAHLAYLLGLEGLVVDHVVVVV